MLAYSGDTEWTDTLIAAAREADLFICECYTRDKPWRGHLSLTVLREKLAAMAPKRLILTHMGEDMLSNTDPLPFETASDGAVFHV